MPSTLGGCGLTGNTVPPNGLLMRFQSTVRPTLPGLLGRADDGDAARREDRVELVLELKDGAWRFGVGRHPVPILQV